VDAELTQEQLQAIWDEEARGDAGDKPADEPQDAAPLAEQAAPQDALPDPDPEPQAQAPADPLAGLPDEVRAALAKIPQLEQANAQLLHHVKTAEGRVAAMQREFQTARQAAAQVAPQDAPSQNQVVAASKNPEKWEQLKQDFPEWASAMEEYVTAKLGSVKPAAPGLDPQAVADLVQQRVAQSEAKLGVAIEEARIEGKYENWRDVVKTNDFTQWFLAQPAEVRVLADSTAARDAIRMLDLFHATKTRSANDIRQERGARLAAAATTRPGATPPPKTLGDMSPEDLWNFEAAQREKTRAQRGF